MRIHERGAAILLLALLLLLIATITSLLGYSIMTSNYRMMADKTNVQQAWLNAETALTITLTDLKMRRNEALKNPPTSSNYRVSYSKPEQNNPHIIEITAIGKSSQNNLNRAIMLQVSFFPLLKQTLPFALFARSQVQLQQQAVVSNLDSPLTIVSGGAIKITGSAKTTNKNGDTSNNKLMGFDLKPNDLIVAQMNETNFFSNLFILPLQSLLPYFQKNISAKISSHFNTSLFEKNNTAIIIKQISGDAIIDDATELGTFDHPILLVVEGNLIIKDQAKINGFVYVSQTLTCSDHALLEGAAAADEIIISKQAKVIYSEKLLNNLQQQVGNFVVIPDSWRDFS